MTSSTIVRSFRQGDEAAFAALNFRWIDELFGAEEEDRRLLENPQAMILDRGGYIAIAENEGSVVGTGALLIASHPPRGGDQWGEIVKMATDPNAQGKGVGGAVIDHLIKQARAKEMAGLWLETNDRLKAATALYERKGFERLSAGELWETPYARCNLQMVLRLPD